MKKKRVIRSIHIPAGTYKADVIGNTNGKMERWASDVSLHHVEDIARAHMA